MKNYIICVGRQHGSGGREIANLIASKLNVPCYDALTLRDKAKEMGIEESVFEMYDEQPTKSFLFALYMDPYAVESAVNEGEVAEAQRKVILQAADDGPCVIVGRRADQILQDRDNIVSIYIGADIEDRIERVLKRNEGVSAKAAKRAIDRRDRERANYYNYFGEGKWGAINNYDMCFNSSRLSKDEIADLTIDYLNKKLEA